MTIIPTLKMEHNSGAVFEEVNFYFLMYCKSNVNEVQRIYISPGEQNSVDSLKDGIKIVV